MTLWKKQSPALEHREQTGDEIVCQYFLEGSRVYTTFPDVHSYAKFILSENDTANELLYGAVHTFFDIDSKVTLSDLGFDSVPEFVAKFMGCNPGTISSILSGRKYYDSFTKETVEYTFSRSK